MRIAALLLTIAAGGIAAAATPLPPAIPPAGPLPRSARMDLLSTFENDISQEIGREITITSLHIYSERDGSKTTCIVGIVEGHRTRLAINAAKAVGDPTPAKWAEIGCSRPGYQLIH